MISQRSLPLSLTLSQNHKDALQASLKEILEEFENEMKLDFWDVKRASDCEKVLASWNRTLLQCKQRFGGAEDGYMGGGADDDGGGSGGPGSRSGSGGGGDGSGSGESKQLRVLFRVL